ncbi:hypothetical protein [Haladaptatus halobius]|uniref:hypothetical protein n=1 Tax=Haladaptatus halobius TaxID=2884875 RepID=UPI001D0A4603|nr:hypothetical protein [Haladaptatus halobius]
MSVVRENDGRKRGYEPNDATMDDCRMILSSLATLLALGCVAALGGLFCFIAYTWFYRPLRRERAI